MALRNTVSGEVFVSRCQTTDCQEVLLTTNVEESGIWEDHEWDGFYSLYNLETDVMGLILVREKKVN
jgi:hypothetical protein